MSRSVLRSNSVMVFAGLVALGSLVVLGCHEMSNPAAPPMPETQSLQTMTGNASQSQTAVCHQGDLGPETLWVSPNAVPAHLAHGDTAGECGAAVECPCYDNLELAEFETSFSLCFDSPSVVSIFDLDNDKAENLASGMSCQLLIDGASVEFHGGLSQEVLDACNDILRAKISELGLTCLPS